MTPALSKADSTHQALTEPKPASDLGVPNAIAIQRDQNRARVFSSIGNILSGGPRPRPLKRRGGNLNHSTSSGAAICLAAQPSTVFGSPDVMVQRGVGATLTATASLADAIVKAVSGKSSARDIKSAIDGAAKRFGTSRIEKPIGRELMHGALLGALDAWYESETDTAVAVESFAARHPGVRLLITRDTKFASHPLADAIKAFIEKKAVTRDVFDQMEKAAQRRAFTVANAANEAMVRTVKQELVRQLAVGADLRDFGKHAAARFESAGWTPAGGSHVETIFRTNVLNAYGSGRANQMLQPDVLAVRPMWQWLGVGDGPPRQRPTHQAMHGVVLLATDPFWQRAYPPAGYNCRCRCRSLSIRQGAPKIQDGARFTQVPDHGFTSGLSQLLGSPSAPANDPPPERERAND